MTIIYALLFFSFGLASSAAEVCLDGQREAIDGSCQKYIECRGGESIQQSCGMFHLFDSTTKECKWKWGVDCVDKARECEDGKLYPSPNGCSLYYSCYGGRLSLQFCPLLHVFDVTTGQCNFGFTCDKASCTASESRVVDNDCSRYDQCTDGKWVRRSCAPLYRYNAITESCEMGGCMQCTNDDTKPSSTCSSFMVCKKGLWTDDSCALFRRYDQDKKKCVWSFQYTCPSTFN